MLQTKAIEGGRVKVFREPKEHLHYVLGIDCASGKLNANESVIQCLCIENGHQCAIVAGQIEPEDIADEALKLGRYYREAEIAVERELHGMTVIDKLKSVYSNIYMHQNSLDDIQESVSRKYGWEPRSYRSTAIDWLVTDIGLATSDKPEERKKGVYVYDLGTISQLTYFNRNKQTGKYEAAPGKMDDRVASLYIANFVRREKYGLYVGRTEEKPRERTFLDVLSEPSNHEDGDRSMDFGEF